MLQVLVVQQESASWLMDAVRSIFWFLAKGVLLLLDGMFLIIDDIWKFKFFDNPYCCLYLVNIKSYIRTDYEILCRSR